MSGYLTPAEVAELLNVGKSTVYRAIQSGELVAHRIGGYRVTPDAIQRFVEMRRIRPTYENGLANSKPSRPAAEPVIDFEALLEPTKEAA